MCANSVHFFKEKEISFVRNNLFLRCRGRHLESNVNKVIEGTQDKDFFSKIVLVSAVFVLIISKWIGCTIHFNCKWNLKRIDEIKCPLLGFIAVLNRPLVSKPQLPKVGQLSKQNKRAMIRKTEKGLIAICKNILAPPPLHT